MAVLNVEQVSGNVQTSSHLLLVRIQTGRYEDISQVPAMIHPGWLQGSSGVTVGGKVCHVCSLRESKLTGTSSLLPNKLLKYLLINVLKHDSLH